MSEKLKETNFCATDIFGVFSVFFLTRESSA